MMQKNIPNLISSILYILFSQKQNKKRQQEVTSTRNNIDDNRSWKYYEVAARYYTSTKNTATS